MTSPPPLPVWPTALGLHRRSALEEHALVQMQHGLRLLRGLRVVRDHHDGLVELHVEPPEQLEHLVRALRVELAGRLVEQDERRVGDDGARDGDALLLAARELARVVVQPVGEPDDAERDAPSARRAPLVQVA